MSGYAEYIQLSNYTAIRPFISIKQALLFLDTKSKYIRARRTEQTNLAINHILFMSDVVECNKLIKEL